MSINQRRCTDVKILSQSCSPDLESLTIECRPSYLPREISSVILTAVYIHPRANTDTAIRELSAIIARHKNASPDCLTITAGGFNEANLKRELPKLRQLVTCRTRGNKTLDHCYCSHKNAYKSVERPALGNSDHSMVLLKPSYKQQLKQSKPGVKSVKQWKQWSPLFRDYAGALSARTGLFLMIVP